MAQNLLLEEHEDDEVGALLADSIGNSMRTVLQTVAPRAAVASAAGAGRRYSRSSVVSGALISTLGHRASLAQSPAVEQPSQPELQGVEDDGFEQVLF